MNDTSILKQRKSAQSRRRRCYDWLFRVGIVLSMTAWLVSPSRWWWALVFVVPGVIGIRAIYTYRQSRAFGAFFWNQIEAVDAYTYTSQGAQRYHDGATAVTAPVIVSRAQAVSSDYSAMWQLAGGYTAQVYHMRVERDIDSRPRAAWSSSITSYAVEYTVVKIELNTSVPHMFIDGLQRNPFRAHNRDLWSLSKRLSRADRVRALEGDFYKFFDVYIADKDAIAALSILTPDVMIQLRDNGYEFDYELYDSAVYIIGPSHRRRAVASIVRQDIDALQQAIEVCMTQLIPQVTGKNFLTDKVLRVTNTNELLFGWLFSVLLIVRWLWIITLYCAVALVIAVVLLLMT